MFFLTIIRYHFRKSVKKDLLKVSECGILVLRIPLEAILKNRINFVGIFIREAGR